MKRYTHRSLLIALLLVMISLTTSVTNPVAASSQPVMQPIAQHVTVHDAFADPSPTVNLAPAFARSTLSASLVKVEFQQGGLYVVARFVANNLKGYTVRMSLFMGWGNGDWMEPNPNTTPAEYISPGGFLSQHYVGTADYTNTEWRDVEFYLPWEYFPPVSQNTNVFLVTYVGLDGQPYVTSSYRQYFVLLAPSQ